MTGYAINPMQPIPKLWEDSMGRLRVMCEPVEGYVMIRRVGCFPFILTVRQLLDGRYKPVLPKRKIKAALQD